MWTALTFTPESLTNTNFWLLIQHFGSRGRQRHRHMKMEDFRFAKDDNGIEFVTFSEGVTKASAQRIEHKTTSAKA